MSNVIQLDARFNHRNNSEKYSNLVSCFCSSRQKMESVFWLKENAELLNILECTDAELSESDLAPYHSIYGQIENRIRFFPQYYRFLLSICLDLEDLGLDGNKGEAIAHWISECDLPAAELSDLQRAEACRLLARRGAKTPNADGFLDDRLRDFASRSETFALPNKKAAYELTHILFYLSEYGRRDPEVPEEVLVSLEYAGLLAYLEQNADLLAEICIALRYAGAQPPATWERWLARETGAFDVSADVATGQQDDYHEFFVCNWALSLAGGNSFAKQVHPDGTVFFRARRFSGPLREISECIFHLGAGRSGDWHHMRRHVEASLTEDGYDILIEAEQSSPHFEAFFAKFARATPLSVAV